MGIGWLAVANDLIACPCAYSYRFTCYRPGNTRYQAGGQDVGRVSTGALQGHASGDTGQLRRFSRAVFAQNAPPQWIVATTNRLGSCTCSLTTWPSSSRPNCPVLDGTIQPPPGLLPDLNSNPDSPKNSLQLTSRVQVASTSTNHGPAQSVPVSPTLRTPKQALTHVSRFRCRLAVRKVPPTTEHLIVDYVYPGLAVPSPSDR